MANKRGNIGSSDRFYFFRLQSTLDGNCSHKIKRPLLLRRKAMTNPESILKNRESSVQLLSHVWLFAISWTTAREAPLSITKSQCLLKLMSISLVMPSKHLILCCSFSSCFQPFPTLRSFPVSQFFTSRGQNIGVSVSASVLPVNIQDWCPLGWTGLISLQSKGLSRVFSNTTIQKHQFFGAQLISSSKASTLQWSARIP